MKLYLSSVKLLFIVFGIIVMACSFMPEASAHGYVKSPESRGYLCAKKLNQDCGSIIYEPQSLEAPGNFPSNGPADGQIVSAGGAFPKLDEQSTTRWTKVPMKSGHNTFTWKFTAPHATEKFQYFITKQDWNPNKPLKRSDLELFCTVKYNGKRPPEELSHQCVVPERQGYQVILAYWEIADTPNAFYNSIDVDFNSTATPEIPSSTAWQVNKVYVEGDQVTFNNALYQAKWWTKGEKPDKAPVWLLLESSNKRITWQAQKVYVAGDKALYDDVMYQAKWWTKGEEPAKARVWVPIK